jgi:CHASE3 domain sensor protein
MKSLTFLGLALLSVAIVVTGWLIYQSSQQAAQSLQTTTDSTANLNKLAGQVSDILNSLGVKG